MWRHVIRPHGHIQKNERDQCQRRDDKADELGFAAAGGHQQLTANDGKRIHAGVSSWDTYYTDFHGLLGSKNSGS